MCRVALGRHLRGFTLLEVLLVLTISGLAIALLGPRIGERIDAYQQRYGLEAFEDGFRQLPRRARLLEVGLAFPEDARGQDLGDGRPVLELPEGWVINVERPFSMSPLGACSAGAITVLDESAVPLVRYTVEELSCDLVRG